MSLYSNVEMVIAAQVRDYLDRKCDAYFGTMISQGEVITRKLGLYEEQTFRLLLLYEAYKQVRVKDLELQEWGRVHLSDLEINHIMVLVSTCLDLWIKRYKVFIKEHSDIKVEDSLAQKSKVFPWVWMDLNTWTSAQDIMTSAVSSLYVKYKGHYLYRFMLDDELSEKQAMFPGIKFTAIPDIKDELLNIIGDSLPDNVDPDMSSIFIEHLLDNFYDISDTTVDDTAINSQHKDIVKQKHQDFIEYLALQVFSDKGYLYDKERENVNKAIADGEEPSVDDLAAFLLSRAATEPYYDLNLKDSNQDSYDEDDAKAVTELNKSLVNNTAIPAYYTVLSQSNKTPSTDTTGFAFGKKIPNDSDISGIYKDLLIMINDYLKDRNAQGLSVLTTTDAAAWCSSLTDQGSKAAEDKGIDLSFITPVINAACNDLITQVLPWIVPDSSVDTGRTSNFKRYYPSYSASTTEAQRSTTFTRYYPYDQQQSSSSTDRTADFQRYYPSYPNSTAVERTTDFQRYYPDSYQETERISGFIRYYPDNYKDAARTTGFIRYYPDNYKASERVSNFERYYPDNYEEAERTTKFERYYPGNQTETQRVSDFQRYYPDNVTYSQRITNFQRYYPSYLDTVAQNNARTTNFQRYYPDNQTETPRTSNFKRYYPDNQGETPRTTTFKRYYPDNTGETARIGDFKRYYPSNYAESPRTSKFERYYPDNYWERYRTDEFERYYPDNQTETKRITRPQTKISTAALPDSYTLNGTVATELMPTYRTFSGHDMVVMVELPVTSATTISKIIGAFQTITYSIHNEKAPIRVLGNMNAKRYVFGPRTIAGSLILTVFDRHWLKELMGTYTKIKNDNEQYFLSDELPAMNFTISCVNEYGHNAKLAIYGVTIVNEGQVMSINDVYTENTYQFFATNVEYLDRVQSTSFGKGKTSTVVSRIPYSKDNISAVPTDNSENVAIISPDTTTHTTAGNDPVQDVPSVAKPYNPSPAVWDNKYADIIGQYNNDHNQHKAEVALRQAAVDEEQERLRKWMQDVYNPACAVLIQKYQIANINDINDPAVKKRLGEKYEEFKSAYNAFITAKDIMTRKIKRDVDDKLATNLKEIGIVTFNFENGSSLVGYLK